MKEKLLATILLICILAAVTLNTLMIDRKIGMLYKSLADLDISNQDSQNSLQNIANEYQRTKGLISVTVSHDDLTSIDECFIELAGYMKSSDFVEAEITKNRLMFYLNHIRRLSGFNIDSII